MAGPDTTQGSCTKCHGNRRLRARFFLMQAPFLSSSSSNCLSSLTVLDSRIISVSEPASPILVRMADSRLTRELRELSESLSSTDPDHQTLGRDEKDARQLLSGYSSISPKDKTAEILGAFLDHLPIAGKHVLCCHIVQYKQDQASLSTLGNHLYGAILAPSKYILLSCYYYSLWRGLAATLSPSRA